MKIGVPRTLLFTILLIACSLLFRHLFNVDSISYAGFLFQPSFTEHTVAGNYNGAAAVYAIDLDGDGESEWVCEAGPLDSEGSDDECYLWLEEGNWTAEEFVVEIWNNGTEFWKSISISVNLHDDEQGEDGDEHDHSESDHQHGEEVNGDLESLLLSAAVLSFGVAALIWISRNVKGGEEE